MSSRVAFLISIIYVKFELCKLQKGEEHSTLFVSSLIQMCRDVLGLFWLFINGNSAASFSIHDAFSNRPQQFRNFKICEVADGRISATFYYYALVEIIFLIDRSNIFHEQKLMHKLFVAEVKIFGQRLHIPGYKHVGPNGDN